MCKDPLISSLNSFGFYPIKHPDVGNKVFLILSKANGYLDGLGPLSDFISEEGPLPEVEQDIQAADIAGIKSSDFDLDTGLNILGTFLSFLGAPAIGLKAAFSKAKNVVFQYRNVVKDRVRLTKVEKFLTKVTPSKGSRLLQEIEDRGEAYVITELLKSNSFGIVAFDEKGFEVGIDVDHINQLLGVNSKIGVKKISEFHTVFEGKMSASFAFKAYSIWITEEEHPPRLTVIPLEKAEVVMEWLPPTPVNGKEIDKIEPAAFEKDTQIMIKN